ncbi:hypothetical protein, partial [Candidatus Magnetobacterium casense]
MGGELTLGTGADDGKITVTGVLHTVDTYGDAASDDLATITAGTGGQPLYIRANHTDRTIVVKSTGNIDNGGTDITLDDSTKYVHLVYDSVLTKWVVISAFPAASGGLASTDIDTSAELLAITTDETGSASGTPLLVFNQGPTINGATLTGVVDGGGATSVEIPNSDDPDTAAVGQIALDTDGWFRVYNGTVQYGVPITFTIERTITSP